jgi:hypothetical protein
MKKFTLPALFLLISLICSKKGVSQTIEYNFNQPDTIMGSLPFDRTFSFKFTHIDTANVSAIVVRIYETSVTNYRKILKSANYKAARAANKTRAVAITNQDILDEECDLIMKPDSIVKYKDFKDSTAYMKSLITLRPSSDYFIEIKTYKSTRLTADQKAALAKAINNAAAFKKLLNDVAIRNIKNPGSSFDGLNGLAGKMNTTVAVIVRAQDPDYTYHPVDPKDLADTLGHFLTDLANASGRLDEIAANFKKSETNRKLLPNSDSVFKLVKGHLLATDWMSITNGDSAYKAIVDEIDKQKNAFKGLKDDNGADTGLVFVMTKVDAAIASRQPFLDGLVNNTLVEHVDIASASGSTYPKEFLKQASEFIRSDLGLAYVWGIGRANTYVAAQISLGPLDDSIPLREFKGFGNIMRSRLSFMIGISVDAVAEDSVRRGLIGSQALILGSGFKLWQWLKINGGFYMYYGEPRNPLEDRNRLTFKASPFVSLSIDIRVQSLLNGVGNAIFKSPAQTP